VAKSCITIGLHLLLKNGDFFEYRYFTRECTTRLGCGGVFIYHFVTNFLLSLTVKKIWKSVNIWWSYGQELGVLFFFWLTVYYYYYFCFVSRYHALRPSSVDRPICLRICWTCLFFAFSVGGSFESSRIQFRPPTRQFCRAQSAVWIRN